MTDMVDIYVLLTKLKINGYKMAFRCTAYAVYLVMKKKKLRFYGKTIYAQAAKHCNIRCSTAKRYIGLAAKAAYANGREEFHKIAGWRLPFRPPAKLFLCSLANYLTKVGKVYF